MFRLPQSGLSSTATVLSALACVLAGPAVLAQATTGSPVTEDSQVAYATGTSFNTNSTLRGVAVSPVDGTIYVADQFNKHIVMIKPTNGGDVSPTAGTLAGTVSTLTLTGITLAAPSALAVDSSGNLYIADTAQLIKVATPEGTPAASKIAYVTTPAPVALAVDTGVTPYNILYVADKTQHAVYPVTLSTTPTVGAKLTLDSALATPEPVGLAVDTSHNLYYADANTYANHGDTVYKCTSPCTLAADNSIYLGIATTNTYTFEFSAATALPIGMGFDPAGNLYVMDSGVTTSTTSRLFEVPSANDFYLVPFSNLTTPANTVHLTGIALDSAGNLLASDDTNNLLDKLFYNNPLNFGDVDAATTTAEITANFQFNTAGSAIASYQNVQGDYTSEFTEASTTCTATEALGSTCRAVYDATYQAATPGLRMGVFGFTGTVSSTTEILAVGVDAIDLAGAMSLYPGTQATLSQTSPAVTLHEPQGVAVTGGVNTSTTGAFNGSLFIADEGIDYTTNTYPYAAVYQYPITAGAIVTTSAPKSIGSGSVAAPLAVALDAEGDLFVASYGGTTGNGSVYIFQPTYSGGKMSWTGSAKTLTMGTVTLNHPMTLAFDPSGNLYVGDMGPEGTNAVAGAGTEGFIVEVPHGPLACGTSTCTIGGVAPFVLTNTKIGSIPIVFPQSLATDTVGDLFIGDGGDGDTDAGGLDVIPAPVATSTASSVTGFTSLNQPTGLSFDAANDLYVLDSYNERVLVGTISAASPSTVTGNVVTLGDNQSDDGESGLTSTLVTPSAMAVWPGGQNLTITDVGYQPSSPGTANPVQVLTLGSFNPTAVNAVSGSPASVIGVNVGSTAITFGTATYSGPCNGVVFMGTCLGTPYYTLSGCLDSGTLDAGVAETCTATITNGGSATAATFTLLGTGTTYSTLKNVISVNGTAVNSPIGSLTPFFDVASTTTGTVTLTNAGSGKLIISAIAVSGATYSNTGTNKCAIGGTGLAAGDSCTIEFVFSVKFGVATVTVTDNGTGTSNGEGYGGTSQKAYSFYFPFPPLLT